MAENSNFELLLKVYADTHASMLKEGHCKASIVLSTNE